MSDREKLIEAMAMALASHDIANWDLIGDFEQRMYSQKAEVALTAIESHGARVVPVLMTDDMFYTDEASEVDALEKVYVALVAASPYAPEKSK